MVNVAFEAVVSGTSLNGGGQCRYLIPGGAVARLAAFQLWQIDISRLSGSLHLSMACGAIPSAVRGMVEPCFRLPY